MMQNPEVQRKAQEEIDRVVGRGRLPDLSDRDSLPYLQCVMYETLRWVSSSNFDIANFIEHELIMLQ